MKTVFNVLGWLRIALWVVGLSYLIHSAVKPSPEEHLRWGDRSIRAIGVLILLTLLVGGFIWGGWLHRK